MTSIFRVATIGAASALLLTTAALADAVTTPGLTAAEAGAAAQGSSQTQPPATMPAVTTGSIDNDPPFEQRMKDCMAIWDKGTHMTKDQWRRSCRTTLQSLSTN